MIIDAQFWEHLSDHIGIAIAFAFLGALMLLKFLNYLFQNKYRVDYDLEPGTILRIFNNDKKTLIINPTTSIQWIDVILLTYIDNGEDKIVDKHDAKRIRIISVAIIILLIFFMLTGFFLILSAFEQDMNPFNYFM